MHPTLRAQRRENPRVGRHRCIEPQLGQAGLPAAPGGGDGVDADDGLAVVKVAEASKSEEVEPGLGDTSLAKLLELLFAQSGDAGGRMGEGKPRGGCGYAGGGARGGVESDAGGGRDEPKPLRPVVVAELLYAGSDRRLRSGEHVQPRLVLGAA